MKKNILIIPVLSLLFAACEDPFIYVPREKGDTLIINALLRTDDTTHTVWLSRGLPGTSAKMEDAQLNCYINGLFMAKGELNSRAREPRSSQYLLPVKIQPGDEVRLEATCGTLRASATAVAPQPAKINLIKTASVQYKGDYQKKIGHYLACKLLLQDIPNEANCYRVEVVGSTTTTYGEYYEHYTAPVGPVSHKIDFSFREDPILNGEYVNPNDEGLSGALDFFSSAVFNGSCSFKDTDFADDSAEVTVYIPDEARRYKNYVDYYQKADYLRLQFSLLTISNEEYNYLDAINRYKSLGNERPFYDPIPIPSNVEGGLGFFSIATASSCYVEQVPFTEVEVWH